ncbi:DR2241 family protein [Halarchaeum sp. P4]|uniref:DR2241 family protein n=1 Tax=Halarchaeum sp. P4 TaxID=3421639 RepID=UPI003EBBE369
MADGVAALMEAATDGVDFDGLVVENTAYGYRFEAPEVSKRGLDAGELAALADGDPYVENWRYWEETVGGHGTARRAFLRWVEGADETADADGDESDAEEESNGETTADETHPVKARMDDLRESGRTRTWGELRIRVRIESGGKRVYDVRHHEDADVDPRDLDTYRDPLDARELVKHDDDGRYRPLSTAPSLPHGWRFVDLDGRDLTQTVDFVYPATVANWHREREGELDVTHWRETAERQTGIFDVVEDLPEEALAWAAEACCVDSQCLKRREWDHDEDAELDVPRGDGEFPCREPCSLFVSAARKFTYLEKEDEETYELTLTESELEQLGDLVDAVADDRVDEIREADLGDGANRYRARYLRAKRGSDFAE